MARALHLPLLVVLASAISTCASPTAQAARARRATWQLGDAAEEATKEWSSTYASGGVEKLVGCNDLQYDLAMPTYDLQGLRRKTPSRAKPFCPRRAQRSPSVPARRMAAALVGKTCPACV